MTTHVALEGIAEAARRHGVSPQTIRRHIATGRIPAYRSGVRLIRLNPVEVDAALLRRVPTAGAR